MSSDFPPTAPLPRSDRPASDRPTTSARGYGATWRRVRRLKLQRSPLCELALEGCTGWATEVHHRDHDTRNNSAANLCSVCRNCHLKYHQSRR